MLSSPRRPSRTILIFSSDENFLRVLRFMSRIIDSDVLFAIVETDLVKHKFKLICLLTLSTFIPL